MDRKFTFISAKHPYRKQEKNFLFSGEKVATNEKITAVKP